MYTAPANIALTMHFRHIVLVASVLRTDYFLLLVEAEGLCRSSLMNLWKEARKDFSKRWEWFHSPAQRYDCLFNHTLRCFRAPTSLNANWLKKNKHLKGNRVHSGQRDGSWDFYLGQLIMLFAFHEKVSFVVSFLLHWFSTEPNTEILCLRVSVWGLT